jgi:DNA recombination protein RmuC
MMQDVVRLDERVAKLATHFQQAEKDIGDIQTSTRKITSRGQKINEIEVEDTQSATPLAEVTPVAGGSRDLLD